MPEQHATLELPLAPPQLSDEPSINDIIWQIARQVRKSSVSFFVGAGMSCPPPSNVPAGSELGARIVRELFPERISAEEAEDLAKTFPLEILAEALLQHGILKRPGLEDFLRQQVSPTGSDPHSGHAALVALAPYLTRIYTTNFDRLIEIKFKHGVESATSSEDFAKVRKAEQDGIPVVLHLHGAVPGPFAVTETDLLTLTLPFMEFLRADLMNHTFIFVGYSLIDPDLRPVYFQIMNTIRANQKLDKKTFVVSKVDVGPRRDLAEKCWNARGFDLISMDASEFMQVLSVAVRYYEQRDEFEAVTTRLHGQSGDRRTLAADIGLVTSNLADLRKEDVLDCLDELTRRGT